MSTVRLPLVDVRPLSAINKVEIEIDRIVVTAQTGGQSVLDIGEVERLVTLFVSVLANFASTLNNNATP